MNKQLRGFYLSLFITFLFLNSGSHLLAQQLYVGSGGQFFYKNTIPFTTGNTVVTVADGGTFTLNDGNDWGSPTEYVDGSVNVIGSGTTLIPVGDGGKFAPVTLEHNSAVTAAYVNAAPSSGSLGTNVDAVSDVEYWKLTGSAVVTLNWDDQSNITDLVNNNGGKLSSVAVVGLQGGTWDLVSAPQTNIVNGDLLSGDVTTDPNVPVSLDTFSEFTFGIDHQAVLAVDDLFAGNGFTILSNPVPSGSDFIEFSVENDLKGLDITIYDINGRKLKAYRKVATNGGLGYIRKPNLRTGIYFVKFVHEGKQGVKKIIIN